MSLKHCIIGIPTHFFLHFLASAYLFDTAATYPQLGIERMPLGGSLFHLDRNGLSKRQDAGTDFGADCGGDAACTTTWHCCECRFADESWVGASDRSPKEDPPTGEPKDKPPPTPKNDPVDPLGKLHCEPIPPIQPKDAHEENVKLTAKYFCDYYASSDDQDLANLPIA
ncbi:MAG: hypothetical protein Q9164_004742 [Protoblastenia rupestris]